MTVILHRLCKIFYLTELNMILLLLLLLLFIIIIFFFKIGSYLTHSLKIQKNVTSCMIGLLNCSIFFIKKNCFILEKGNVSKLFPIYIYIYILGG